MTKYHAKRTPCRQGQMHASGAEARRCDELSLLQRVGEIQNLKAHPQPHWDFVVYGVKVGGYTADFEYEDKRKGWATVVEDCKGVKTRDLPLRLKLMKALFGIEVYLSKARRG